MLIFNSNKLRKGLQILVLFGIVLASQSNAHPLGSNLNPVSYGSDQTIVDITKLIWSPLEVEGMPPGAEIAVLRGYLSKAGSESILKLPAGYIVPSHTHTSDELYVWIQGAFTMISHDGKKSKFDGPAYISFPGNAPPHALVCGDKEPCILYLKFSRPFDIQYPKK